MKLDDVHKYYGTTKDCQLEEKIGYSKSAISKWRKKGSIPLPFQCLLEVKTSGSLLADKKSLSELKVPLVMIPESTAKQSLCNKPTPA